MQLDLKKLPFGQYMSRHLLFEEADPLGRGWEKGLYLALAAVCLYSVAVQVWMPYILIYLEHSLHFNVENSGQC